MDGSFALAEPLTALSVASDLARGRPPEETARACVVATQLADELGLSTDERSTVYWTTLVRSIGCTATSHEYATLLGGDDIAVRRAADAADLAAPGEVLGFLSGLTGSAPALTRIARGAALGRRARVTAREGARADCEVGARLATRIGLSAAVAASLADVFERWDGKGFPAGRRGDDIALAARVAAVAHAAVAGSDVSRWAGRALDPSIAARCAEPPRVEDAVAAAVGCEPAPLMAEDGRLDEIALAFCDVADLKAPFLLGHSRAVATLAEAAAERLSLDPVLLRRAALLHDLGRVAVSTGIWEKPGPLAPLEWEAVRLHAYWGERMLARSEVLAALAPVVGAHHERMDGSGYHRGVRASQLSMPARVLAAADVYCALQAPRPHREPVADPARVLGTLPLDPDGVAAVLDAAGQPRPRRVSYPAGLTAREVDVLRLLAQGRSKKQIAAALVVSPSTVHTHVVHIYEKAGVSTRAGVAVFALEHGLLEDRLNDR